MSQDEENIISLVPEAEEQPETYTKTIVTFEVTFLNSDDAKVTEYFDGYAVISGDGFAIQVPETGVPLIILPTSRLLEVRSSTREIEVDANGSPILN